jgi:hypothetical protein
MFSVRYRRLFRGHRNPQGGCETHRQVFVDEEGQAEASERSPQGGGDPPEAVSGRCKSDGTGG